MHGECCARGFVSPLHVVCRYVVNAAGLFSDKIAQMVGDTSFTIKPRLGECVFKGVPCWGAEVLVCVYVCLCMCVCVCVCVVSTCRHPRPAV